MSSDAVDAAFERGLALVADERWFAAHEAFEEAWRAAEPAERDFFQGLVHAVVAWHHARTTGRRVACGRQLVKAERRLHPYAPSHRDVDVAVLLTALATARRAPFPDLPSLRLPRTGRGG